LIFFQTTGAELLASTTQETIVTSLEVHVDSRFGVCRGSCLGWKHGKEGWFPRL